MQQNSAIMKIFLKVDYFVQIVLFSVILIGILFTAQGGFFLALFTYLLIGGWQLLSGIIHAIGNRTIERTRYLQTAFAYLGGLLLVRSIEFPTLTYLYLSGSLLIAVWYFVITHRAYESQNIVRSFWDLEI